MMKHNTQLSFGEVAVVLAIALILGALVFMVSPYYQEQREEAEREPMDQSDMPWNVHPERWSHGAVNPEEVSDD